MSSCFDRKGFSFRRFKALGIATLLATSLSATKVQATWVLAAGDGDSQVDAGECNDLFVGVTNTTGVALTNLTATLIAETNGVVATWAQSLYPDIAPDAVATNLLPFQFQTTSAYRCGQPAGFRVLLFSGTDAVSTNTILIPGAPAGAPMTFENNIETVIPAEGSITSVVSVAAFPGAVRNPTASLYVTGTNQLLMTLVPPGGFPSVLLSSSNSIPGDFGASCAEGDRTTFDDAAPQFIASAPPPRAGSYQSVYPMSDLEGRVGASVNGDWRLIIQDVSTNASTSTLHCWSLKLSPCSIDGGPCGSCNPPIAGAITDSDALSANRLQRDGEVSVCGIQKPFPGVFPVATGIRFDTYTFTNADGPACVSVTVEDLREDFVPELFSSAYLTSFDPGDLAQNYLADIGSSVPGHASGSYSFQVPSNATFVVVVNETRTGQGSNYVLRVDGLDCPQTLALKRAGADKIALRWSSSAVPYRLTSTTNLANPLSWSTVTNAVLTEGGDYVVTNSIAGPQRLYRLKKQ